MKYLSKYKYNIFLILFIISLLASLTLSLSPIEAICNLEKGCSVVRHSEYNFTFGIKNSHYGTVIFAFLSLLTFLYLKKPTKNKRKIITIAIIIGSIIALYFIYLQQFILKAYCEYCMVVDVSILLAFLILILTWKH